MASYWTNHNKVAGNIAHKGMLKNSFINILLGETGIIKPLGGGDDMRRWEDDDKLHLVDKKQSTKVQTGLICFRVGFIDGRTYLQLSKMLENSAPVE